MRILSLAPLLVASCVPLAQPGVTTYVASVRPGPGALAAIERCGLDVHGRRTGWCSTDYVAASSPRALAAATVAAGEPAGPPPTLREAMHVVNDGEVHTRLDACRRDYGSSRDRLRFALDIAPSGDVDRIVLPDDTESWFRDCAYDALDHVRFAPFDGPRQHYELMVML